MTVKNNSNLPTLPIYVQKIIVKELCKQIDSNSKIIEVFQISPKFDQKANQLKNDKLIMSIALVCHQWFKTLSNNLTVSVDFNFKEKGGDKWSIIKRENIKTLHLHYDPINSTFFKKLIYSGESINNNNNNNRNYKNYNNNSNNKKNNNNNKNQSPIKKPILIGLKNLNEKLMKLSSTEQQLFKKLIINTIDDVRFQEEDYKMIKSLHQCKAIKNIHLFRYQVNDRTTMNSLTDIKKRIKKLYSLEIINQLDKRIIIETIIHWNNSIRKLSIEYDIFSRSSYTPSDRESIFINDSQLYEFLFSSKNIENEKEIYYLSNLESLNFLGTEFTIQNLVELVFATPSMPKLKSLSIGLCFINLVYFLTEENERGLMARCGCDSIIKFYSCGGENYHNSNNPFGSSVPKDQLQEQTKEFKNQWSKLLKLLNNNQVLLELELTNKCIYGNQLPKSSINPSFITNISLAITSIKKLVKFSLVGLDSTIIFNQILKDSKSISFFNLKTYLQTPRLQSLIEEIQKLIDSNPHINQFKLINGKFIPEDQEFIYTTEFIFEKNKKQKNQTKSNQIKSNQTK
ncbi:hypothetical protein RB653_003352 [Dictyostelium firmibasis]|uniref:Uncharacterized protein n=1 Tax=Dictyostelium firmibasis TaxID=79012 RepID=A0AAN7TXN5_9MYCE